jgi:hypothetical protein
MERLRARQGQDHDGRRAPLDGHERGRRSATPPTTRPATPSSAIWCPEHDPVYKVTIIPRGRALGSNDFERATKLARAMVTKYGMSDALGTMVYADDKDSGFGLQNKTISEATQQKVDAEIRRILDEQYAVAHRILEDKRSVVEAMAAALLEWETIDAEQVKALMEGRTPSPPPGWVAKPPAGGGKDDSSTPTAPVLVDPAPQT